MEHPGFPKAKQLCHLHTQLSLGAELPEAKKVSCLCTQGRFGHVQLFVTLYTVACQASLSGVYSRQEYWNVLGNPSCHILREHYISCSLAANSPEYLVLPEPLPPKQRHHCHTWPSQGQTKSSRQPQEQTPVDDPHAEVEIKPQLKPRGSVTKEEDQSLPTSCTSCRLNPHDQLGRLCVCGIYKRSLRAPATENTLALIAVDIGGKKTQE